jgi:hypothetical protein
VYIGKTVNSLYDRIVNGHLAALAINKVHYALYSALRKHNIDNFVVTCLISNMPKEVLNNLEIEFIRIFDSFKNGYNMTMGGEGLFGYTFKPEVRKRISEKKKGIPINDRNRQGISKKVQQIDKNTSEVIATFDSITSAYKQTGIANIGMCCHGQLKNAGGFVWKFIHSTDQIKSLWTSSRKTRYDMQDVIMRMNKKVYQYTLLDKQFIAEYSSVKEAIKKTGVKNISYVCRGERNHAGGFYWSYTPLHVLPTT